jgi:hypothetical protein
MVKRYGAETPGKYTPVLLFREQQTRPEPRALTYKKILFFLQTEMLTKHFTNSIESSIVGAGIADLLHNQMP